MSNSKLNSTVGELYYLFNRATKGYPSAERGNASYKLQCEFAWLLHEITNGPKFFIDDNVEKCKNFINKIQPA